ncbi:MAG: hypothetical protein V3U54_08550 [Thermodesulfobacteriota bacterium]
MSIMDLFRRNKPPQKTAISRIKVKDIADARNLKKTVLKEILDDDNYYINGNGKLDKRNVSEVTPFGHLREMRKQKKEDVIGKMLRPLIGRDKDKIRLETRLRAIEFIKDNLAEEATITDGYINALQELLFDQYTRGYKSQVKAKSIAIRKHKKK